MALTITGVQLPDARCGGARVAGGAIVALGPGVEAEPGDDTIDGAGLALVPGLVNGHTHSAMTLLRGFGDDLPLQQWLETVIWPAEALLTPDDVYWGTRLACVEMIRTGTTRCWDMYFAATDVARAFDDAGMRATVSQVVLEAPGAPVEVGVAAAPDALDALAAAGARITPSLGPHSIYAVGDAALAELAALVTARGVPLQIHLAETQHEVLDCIDAHGCRPAQHLDRLGLLTDRTVLAHGVWLDEEELELIAERGATVVTNPASNMKLAVGRAFPYPEATAAGVAIGIGTDGAASNNSLDLLADLKLLALLQKHAAEDPAVLPAADAWEIATGARAPGLGATPVAVGEPADFLLVDLDAVALTPGPLVPNLVYAASGAVVHTVVVDGRVLMRDRVVAGEEEVRARALECAARVRT
jgi:5-methylthioadenosine/S-adenosylhomocysteine deaminase